MSDGQLSAFQAVLDAKTEAINDHKTKATVQINSMIGICVEVETMRNSCDAVLATIGPEITALHKLLASTPKPITEKKKEEPDNTGSSSGTIRRLNLGKPA